MKTATLFIFLILLLGLILALFLGSRYQEGLEGTTDTTDDEEKEKEKEKEKDTKDTTFDLSKIGIFGASLFPKSSSSSSENSSLSVGTSLYGAHGEMIVVKTDKLGNNYLEMTKTRTSDSVIFELDPSNSKKYYGPRNAHATVFTVNKQPALKVFDSDGNITMYTIDGVRSNLNDSLEDDDDKDTSSSWWSRSKSKSKSKSRSNSRSRSMSDERETKDKNEIKDTTAYTRVNHDTTLSPSPSTGAGLGTGTGVGGFVDSLFNKNSNTNTNAPSMSSASNQSIYSNSLPAGIPASQIPRGQEDLYVLKSQIVPPVCPTCPSCPAFSPATSSSSKSMTTTSMMPAPTPKETCPPCPSCARCPEPSFECKKVPNYNAMNNEFLPIPVLNDFSSFGM